MIRLLLTLAVAVMFFQFGLTVGSLGAFLIGAMLYAHIRGRLRA